MTALLKPEEVAKILSVDERTVRDLCNRGDLRGGKVGRVWRVHPDDLETYIKNVRGLATLAAVKTAKDKAS